MTTNNSQNSGDLYSAGNGYLLIGQTTGQAKPATLTAGSNITITNGTNSIEIAAGGGSGSAVTNAIAQMAHGFSVQQWVYLSGTSSYSLAKADNTATAEAIGIVSAVADANDFTITTSGYVTGLSGLTADDVYYISDATAGLMTTTIPTTVGHVRKPVFVADSSTSGYVINYRGEIISTPVSVGTVTSVATGTGLQGGTITSSGTISLNTTNACNYRLSLTSGLPVTTTDVTGAATIYAVPYGGEDIDLYDGSTSWHRFQPGQLSFPASSLSASTVYDAIIDYNGGSPQLGFRGWTNSTTRGTALVYQNGVLVLSGSTTARYIGTVYVDGSNLFDDSTLNRAVWNYYNRVNRPMSVVDSTASWGYTTATWRQAHANSSNQVNQVIDVAEDLINVQVIGMAQNSDGGITIAVGVGINSTSVNSAQVLVQPYTAAANYNTLCIANYTGIPPIGYNSYVWLESSQAAGSTTWSGTSADGAASSTVSGLTAMSTG